MHYPRKVAAVYLKGWFTIDFVSCIPASYAEYFVKEGEEVSQNNKMIRMLRMVRMVKLLRLVRIKRILARWVRSALPDSQLDSTPRSNHHAPRGLQICGVCAGRRPVRHGLAEGCESARGHSQRCALVCESYLETLRPYSQCPRTLLSL